MKVIIAGSRHMVYTPTIVEDAVNMSGFHILEEVCGMAPGADSFGAKWAYKKGIPIKNFPADWDTYGKAAGFIRNQEMADYADALVLLIWNNSPGSLDMLNRMEILGKPYYVVRDGVLV
jgi:hypothetical protein